MILGLLIGLVIIGIVFLVMADCSFSNNDEVYFCIGIIVCVCAVIIFIFGCFHGFINYPETKGTHRGTVVAVDLEGIWFRRYKVYLKTSNYTTQEDETTYLLYANETELAEELEAAIGKTVKLYYGHDGGYIPWNSCGTYHIKDMEIVEEEK